jgi:Lrp/AsnC family transcriptional regulator for asnA, asnC and gidA
MTKFDVIDRDIVDLLQEDGRLSNLQIASRVGVSETTVRRRLAKMVTDDSIRVVAVANPFKLGINVIAIIGLQVEKSRLREIEGALTTLPEVRFLGLTLGGYDMILEAWFTTHEGLLEFVSDTLGNIPGIQRSESFQIVRLSKYCYDWGRDSSARLAFVRG